MKLKGGSGWDQVGRDRARVGHQASLGRTRAGLYKKLVHKLHVERL